MPQMIVWPCMGGTMVEAAILVKARVSSCFAQRRAKDSS